MRSRIGITHLIVAFGLITLGAVERPHAQKPGNAEDAQTWLKRMEQALGGEAAIAGLKSLSVTASCTGPGGDFQTEVASLRPDWVWFRQTSSDGVTEIWSGPERTWNIGAEGEVKDHGAGVRSFIRAHEFHVVILELATRFTDHHVGSTTTVREQSCTALLMKDDMGLDATLYVSNETHLPVMLETNPEGAAGPVRVYYEKWKEKANVLLFHAFELTEGEERTFRYDYQSIEPNVVSVQRFAEPAPTSSD